ncbi:hypothetical protein [Arthrobacter sp. C152]
MPGRQTSPQDTEPSRRAPAAVTHATGGTGGAQRTYRYRGVPRPDPAVARAEELLSLLAQQKRMISLHSSRLRALSRGLNERVAQAVCDGVKAAPVARAAGMPAATVRGIGARRDEFFPSGQSADSHLATLRELAAELASVEGARAAVEQARAEVLATARKLRLLDDYQLAAASGLKHEEIPKVTRGIATPRASREAPGSSPKGSGPKGTGQILRTVLG